MVYFPGEYIVKDLIQHCEQSERDQRLLGSLNKGKTPRERTVRKLSDENLLGKNFYGCTSREGTE